MKDSSKPEHNREIDNTGEENKERKDGENGATEPLSLTQVAETLPFESEQGIFWGDLETGETWEYSMNDPGAIGQSLKAIDNHFTAIDRALKNLGKSKAEPYTKAKHEGPSSLLETQDYQHSFCTVLLYILSNIKYGGRIPYSRDQIGEKLGLSERTMYRAWKYWLSKDVIKRGLYEGREAYYLASEFGERGASQLKETEKMVKGIRQTATGRSIRVVDGGKH